jgi:deoxyadenosine/deoxycytidine kinase
MGKLIVVVGNSGVGKTTLTRALCASGYFATGLEEHAGRPFQTLFKSDVRYALANQVDYLLLRAEQERSLRADRLTGIQDGGLEMDFHVFTRLFRAKGFLSEQEYLLCERLYTQVRAAQAPPDGILRLAAPLELIAERFTRRSRPLELAERDDLQAIEALLDEWLRRVDPGLVLRLDATHDDPHYRRLLPDALDFIAKRTTVSP